MKIIIDTSGFNRWGGGRDFLNHIVDCLEAVDLVEITIVLYNYNKFGSLGFAKNILKRLLNLFNNAKYSLYPSTSLQMEWFNIRNGRNYHVISPRNRLSYFQQVPDDCAVLPCFFPLGKNSLNWIGYIYDYQHKYLVDYFTKDEITRRDRSFCEMLLKAEKVLVNSKKTRDDIVKFSPEYSGQILVLPYSPHPNKSWLLNSYSTELDISTFGRYFIVCNQLWLHKNHITVIKALHYLINTNNLIDVSVICTGDLSDHRNPNYYTELMALIKDLDLEGKFLFLGHIPKLEQIELLKNAVALVQPTLYEGGPGGGSVYDAVSLGVPVIVSDIDVNREIEKDESILFFEATNSIDLADKMMVFWNNEPLRKTNDELLARGNERKIACGKYIIDNI